MNVAYCLIKIPDEIEKNKVFSKLESLIGTKPIDKKNKVLQTKSFYLHLKPIKAYFDNETIYFQNITDWFNQQSEKSEKASKLIKTYLNLKFIGIKIEKIPEKLLEPDKPYELNLSISSQRPNVLFSLEDLKKIKTEQDMVRYLERAHTKPTISPENIYSLRQINELMPFFIKLNSYNILNKNKKI